MSVEAALVTRLKAVSAVTDMVGSGANARIWHVHSGPRVSARPLISFELLGAAPVTHPWGAAIANRKNSYRFHVWAETGTVNGSAKIAQEHARDLADAVIAALNGFSDATIRLALLAGEFDGAIPDGTGTADLQVAHRIVDIDVDTAQD